jgi:endonuclease/exonuclease/phosphatase family metal-dependent hydrolase
VATRLPIEEFDAFAIDNDRAAVYVKVKLESGQAVKILGTHLDHEDENGGRRRLSQAREVLKLVGDTGDERVLILGDFNQQRSKDYTNEEWAGICANKKLRGSPYDDGVAGELSKVGFSCVWDNVPVRINWIEGDPPPSTHWTGTLIDYTYSRGLLKCCGLFVSPSGLSDHRLIVSDWKLNAN